MAKHIREESVCCPGCKERHIHKIEWECTKNCPEHGPFPTDWDYSGSGPWMRDRETVEVRWYRYIAPNRIEYKLVKHLIRPPE